MNEDIRGITLRLVNESTGIKAVELLVQVVRFCVNNKIRQPESLEFAHLLEDMVFTKEIVEVEYIIPSVDYKVKSIFFPKGTQITIK